jgi:cyclin H
MFLSTKIEDERMSLDEFLDKIEKIVGKKFSSEMMNKIELVILDGLNFDLILYHPHRSLTAFIHDFTSLHESVNRNELFEKSMKYVHQSYLTDASLIFTPSIVALASIYFNCELKNEFIS